MTGPSKNSCLLNELNAAYARLSPTESADLADELVEWEATLEDGLDVES